MPAAMTGAVETHIHLILEVRDTHKIAFLVDYRRLVIEIDDRIIGHRSVQKW